MDLSFLPAVIISFTATIAVILLLRPLAPRLRLVDRPGGRKHHIGAIPIVGGVAMFVGVVSGVIVMGDIDSFHVAVIFSIFLLVAVGAVDDAFGVTPQIRILFQAVALLIVILSGNLLISSFGDPFGFGEIHLGPFALLVTLVVGVTVINAYNLIDGADGLAAIFALIPLIAAVIIGSQYGLPVDVASMVSAGILAYLVFNFPAGINRPVKTFMGDAGSTMLGFVVFFEGLRITQGPSAVISPVAGLWLASIPIYDLFTCFLTRIRKGRSPFTAGRDHYHHMLRRGGFSDRQKIAFLGGLQVIYAVTGVAGALFGASDLLLFAGWIVIGLTQKRMIKAISRNHRAMLRSRLARARLVST